MAKEQTYFSSEFGRKQSDFSVSAWVDNRKNANISTFAEANRRKQEREMEELWQMELAESFQELVIDEQSNKTETLIPNSIELKDKSGAHTLTNRKPLKPLSGVLQNQYLLPNPERYQQAHLALVKASFIPPVKMKLTKPNFTPSLRLGLTGSVFSSISNIPNSSHIAYNSGLTLEWQTFRNFGFTGAMRYNKLAYGVVLETNNQELLRRFPNTENINSTVETISATHHYLDLPVGIIWKIPVGSKENKLYLNPSIAWQFYLPQTFEYETFDKNTIITQNNRLYAYFGSTMLNLGYEQKIRDNLRLQMGIWAERSFVEYGLDNRSGTNVGATATLFFGK